MKRIKQFSAQFTDGPSLKEVRQFTSWHAVWDAAVDWLADHQSAAAAVEVRDGSGKFVIACFSSSNRQAEQAQQGESQPEPPRWETSPLRLECPTDGDFFANLNVLEVQWAWIDGARREVPMLLNLMERRVARKPEGMCAMAMGLLSEYRDLLGWR